MKPADGFTYSPLTPERWQDFESLFGPRGAVGGCWCMWWRLTRSEFSAKQGEGNRLAMKAIVDAGEIPGLLAYQGSRLAGWVSVAPREHFPVLQRSPILKPVDDQPVWSVVCFFIAKPYRRQGMTTRLIKAAVEHASQHGAKIVEGYPIKPLKDEAPDIYAFTGLASSFIKAGFEEAASRSPTRPIMRYYLQGGGR